MLSRDMHKNLIKDCVFKQLLYRAPLNSSCVDSRPWPWKAPMDILGVSTTILHTKIHRFSVPKPLKIQSFANLKTTWITRLKQFTQNVCFRTLKASGTEPRKPLKSIKNRSWKPLGLPKASKTYPDPPGSLSGTILVIPGPLFSTFWTCCLMKKCTQNYWTNRLVN